MGVLPGAGGPPGVRPGDPPGVGGPPGGRLGARPGGPLGVEAVAIATGPFAIVGCGPYAAVAGGGVNVRMKMMERLAWFDVDSIAGPDAARKMLHGRPLKNN